MRLLQSTLSILSMLYLLIQVPSLGARGSHSIFDGGAVIKVASFRIHVAADAQYKKVDDSTIRIDAGEVLVEAFKRSAILTPLGATYMKPGAVVLFRVSTGLERVTSLWDLSAKSVVVVCSKSGAFLCPGDEVVLSDHKPYYREIHQTDRIGRREVKRFFVGNDLFMTTSEVSLQQVLLRTGLLHADNASDRNLSAKVLKAAHILESMRWGREPFESGMPLDASRFNPHDPLSVFEDLMPPVTNHGAAAATQL